MDLQGEELRRSTKPIRSYGYICDATFAGQGRYWRQDEHFDDEDGDTLMVIEASLPRIPVESEDRSSKTYSWTMKVGSG